MIPRNPSPVSWEVNEIKRIEKTASTHAFEQSGVVVCVGVYKNGKYARKPLVYRGSGASRAYHPDSPFKTIEEADVAAKEWVKKIATNLPMTINFSRKTREMMATALSLTQQRKTSLLDVVARYFQIEDLVPAGANPVDHFKKLTDLVKEHKLLEPKKVVSIYKLVEEVLVYIAETNGKGTVYRDYHSAFSIFAKAMDCPVNEIDSVRISKWLSGLKTSRTYRDQEAGRPVSPATRNSYHNKLIYLYDIGWERGVLQTCDNPARDVRKVTKKQMWNESSSDIAVYSVELIQKLLSDIKPEFQIVVELVALGGLRQIEAFRIAWEDVFRVPALIDVRKGVAAKKKDARQIPILPSLDGLLEKYRGRFAKGELSGRIMGHLFPNVKNSALFSRHLNEAIHQVVGAEFAPNGLRHSFASYLLPQIGNPSLLAAFMGNSDNMIFENYARVGISMDESNRYVSIGTELNSVKRKMKLLRPLLDGMLIALKL